MSFSAKHFNDSVVDRSQTEHFLATNVDVALCIFKLNAIVEENVCKKKNP